MPNSADSSPATDARRPRFTWTWPRLLLTGFFICLCAVAAWIFYDQPLRPADDLTPKPVTAVPDTENGREFLRVKWQNLPGMIVPTRLQMERIRDGRGPWDPTDPELVSAAAEGKARLAELQEAIAMPFWQNPVRVPGTEDVWDLHANDFMDATLLEQVHLGDLATSGAILNHRLHAARRELDAGGPGVGPFSHAVRRAQITLSWIPQLLAVPVHGPDSLYLSFLQAMAEDWISREQISLAARSNFLACRKLLPGITSTELVTGTLLPPQASRILWKPNTTLNRCAADFRLVDPLWLKPLSPGGPSIHSLWQEREAVQNWRQWIGGNRAGERFCGMTMRGWYLLDSASRTLLFQQRGMAVRIALHRWKLAHGSLPAKLTELVPDFLAAVPADPWDGRPLRWDPARFGGMLYSVGQDLTDDPGQSFDHGKKPDSWVDTDMNCPAIRLELPAPPPVP